MDSSLTLRTWVSSKYAENSSISSTTASSVVLSATGTLNLVPADGCTDNGLTVMSVLPLDSLSAIVPESYLVVTLGERGTNSDCVYPGVMTDLSESVKVKEALLVELVLCSNCWIREDTVVVCVKV